MTEKEKMFKKNINHSEKENQVAGNSELILNFQEFWEKGARAFVPTIKERGKPTKKPGVCCLAKKLGKKLSDSIKIRQGKVFRGNERVFLYELYRVFDEEEYKKFLEDEIKEGHNLFIYSHQLKGGDFLHFLDIDCGKENKERVLKFFEQKFPYFSFVVETSNGLHLWFYYSEQLEGKSIKNAKLNDEDGEIQISEISLRGLGQGVVFPGSIHPETREKYKIIKGSFDDIPLINDLSEIFYLFGGAKTKKERVKVVGVKADDKEVLFPKIIGVKADDNKKVLFRRISCSPDEIREIEDILRQNDFALWDIWSNGFSPRYEKYKKEKSKKSIFDRSVYEIDLVGAIWNGIKLRWRGLTDGEIAGKIKDFVLRKEKYEIRDENGNVVATIPTKFRERGDKYIDKILIDLQGEEGYLRERVKGKIKEEVEDFFEEVKRKVNQGNDLNDPVVIHLNFPPGSGKSRIARRVLAKKIEAGDLGLKAGIPVIVVVGTHKLGDEWFEDLKKLRVNVKKFSGRSKENCKIYEHKINQFAIRHRFSLWLLCKVCQHNNGCPYYKQIIWLKEKGDEPDEDFPDVIIATYEFFKFWSGLLLKISRLVIFDDVKPKIEKDGISFDELEKAKDILQGEDEVFLLETLLDFLKKNRKGDFYQYAKEKFQSEKGKYYSKSDFSKLISRIGGAIDNLFTASIRNSEDLGKLPSRKVVDLLNYLVQGEDVEIKAEKVFWYRCDEIGKNFHLLILGWTTSTDDLKIILTRKQIERYREVVSDGTAENLLKRQIKVKLIDKKGVSSRGFDRNKRRYLNGVVPEIERGSLCFCHKKAKNEIKNELEGKLEVERDFFVRNWLETRGLNEFSGKVNSIILAGFPIPNLKEFRKEYSFKSKIQKKKGIEIRSLKEEIVQKACEEIVQNICRARGQVQVKAIANFSPKNYIVQKILQKVSRYADIQTITTPTTQINEDYAKRYILEDLEEFGGVDLYGLIRRHFESFLKVKTFNLHFDVSLLKRFSNEKYGFGCTSIYIREVPDGIRRDRRIKEILRSVARLAGAKFVKIKVRGWRIKKGGIAVEYTCEKSAFVKDFEKFRKSLFKNEDEVIVAVLKNGRWVEIKDEFTEKCLSELRDKIETFNRKVLECITRYKLPNIWIFAFVYTNKGGGIEYTNGKERWIVWFNRRIKFKKPPVLVVEQEHPG